MRNSSGVGISVCRCDRYVILVPHNRALPGIGTGMQYTSVGNCRAGPPGTALPSSIVVSSRRPEDLARLRGFPNPFSVLGFSRLESAGVPVPLPHYCNIDAGQVMCDEFEGLFGERVQLLQTLVGI